MSNSNYNKSLHKIFKDVFKLVDEHKIENASIDNSDFWDSLGHLRLFLEISKEFNIKIDNDKAFELTSYKKINDFLKNN